MIPGGRGGNGGGVGGVGPRSGCGCWNICWLYRTGGSLAKTSWRIDSRSEIVER